MTPMPDYARELALDVVGGGQAAVDRLKADAARCQAAYDSPGGVRSYCSSYTRCYLAVMQNVYGERGGPFPVCPVSVLRALGRIKGEVNALDL